MEGAIIHIERKPAWGDFFRVYTVFLDEKPIGGIRQGLSRSFEVHPGRHEVFLNIDWCSSRRMSIDLAPGEEVKLICQGRDIWDGLRYMTFGANNYIKLFQEPFEDLIMS
jgi:hypothetical protein